MSFTYEGQSISPSALAADQQGITNTTYYNQDVFKDGVVEKGTLVACITYDTAKGPSDFFIPYEQYKQIVDTYGPDAWILCSACQIAPFYDEKMGIAQDRTKVEIYRVNAPIEAAYGTVRANDQFGPGGATQIYMPKSQELVEQGFLAKVEEGPLFNYTRDLSETDKLLFDARERHKKLYGERKEFKYKKENVQMEGIDRDLAPPAFQVEQFDESQFKEVSQTEATKPLENTTNQSLEEAAAVQESTVNKETHDEALQKNDNPGLNQNDMDTTPNVQWDSQAIIQRLDTKMQAKDAQGPEETANKPRLDSWYVTKAEDTELTEKQGNNLAQTQEKSNDGFVWPKWFHADYQQDKLSQSLGYENFDKLKEIAESCGEKNGIHYYASEDLKTGKIVIWKDKNYEKVAEFPDKQKWQELTKTEQLEQVIRKGIVKLDNQPGSEKSRGMELNR